MTFVQVKVATPCATITLSRGEKLNALNREVIRDLNQALSDLHQEKRVRSIILTGDDRSFCSGLDLQQMRSTSLADPPSALTLWHEDWLQIKDLFETMLRFPKPIIAAVDGLALGAGLGLVLAADIVVASKNAVFGLPAIRRGLVSGVVAPLLNFRAGGKVAARMLLTGREVSSDEALSLGFVDETTESSDLLSLAHSYAESCANSPAEAVQLSKRLLNETIGEQVLTQMSVGAAMGATSCTTEAAAEGLSAFVEKREPNWP